MGHKNYCDKSKKLTITKPYDVLKPFSRFIIVSNYKNYLFKTLPKGIFAVSLFGLFLGASTTMVYSQLPMFMKHELHASALKIAFIDGVVEFLSFLMRVFSGAASDYLRNRKFILLLGSIIILSIKPLFAFAKSAVMVMFAQSVDRLGNGFQASPRDALIADLSSKHTRAQSFGFSKSLKTVGSLLGSAIAIILMYLISNNYRLVFLYSTIPVIIAIICLYNLKSHKISEPIIVEDYKHLKNPFKRQYLKSMDLVFWKLILLAVLFELGHFSEHLLVLRANDFIEKSYAGSVGMFISVGQVLFSYPIGLYADRFGKRIFIQLCMVLMIAASISMIYAPSIIVIFFGAFLWGGQMTAIQGLILSVISDKVNHHLIGTAIGIYYIAIGVAYLIASIIAGYLWNHFGSNLAFIYSILCVLFSLSLFPFLYPNPKGLSPNN